MFGGGSRESAVRIEAFLKSARAWPRYDRTMKTLLDLLDFEGVMEVFESPGLIAGLVAGAVLSALRAAGPGHGAHAVHGHLLAAAVAFVHHACG